MKADRSDRCRVVYRVDPPVGSQDLDELFAAAWPWHKPRDWDPVLERSLVYLCAYSECRLVGFVNVAWDGGVHGFLLDTTVHPEFQRRGIASELVRQAAVAARERGASWLHVDYEPHLEAFYAACGFRPTAAGLIRL